MVSLATLLLLAGTWTGPAFEFSSEVEVAVGEGGALDLVTASAGASPEWIYYLGQLAFRCPGAAMRGIELDGPVPGRKVRVSSSEGPAQSGSVPVQVPLWPVSAAVAACGTGQATLSSAPFVGTLRCEGLGPVRVELRVPLKLRCSAGKVRARRAYAAPRVRSAEHVLVGSTEPTRVSLAWALLRPTPSSARLVELDDDGGVVEWHQALPAPGLAQTSAEASLQLDTSAPRNAWLAVELTFPDGSKALSAPGLVTVESPAQREAALKAIQGGFGHRNAVGERLQRAFADPCKDPEATVAWLRAQPEVSHAAGWPGGRVAYVVDGVPVTVLCRER
jgi:hypothetical protein